MERNKLVSLFLILACVVAVHDYAEAQYNVPHYVSGNGGLDVKNGSYRLRGTVGQAGIGASSNAVNIHDAGFWYPAGNFLTSIEFMSNQLPEAFCLRQNYPNPFNPTTAICYQLPAISQVDLSIYNTLGQKVATLVSENQPAGYYTVHWDASGLASGVYFYRLEAGEFVQTKKMILVR